MEKLWSPWRSQYIESFKTKDGTEECVFCAAVSQNINDDTCIKVFENEQTYIILNLYPYNNGHLMVVPKRHVSDYLELEENELKDVTVLIGLSMKALKKLMVPHGFNVGANLGKAAGAGIHEHIHFHILPRWTGDTNFMPALGEVKVISQDLLKAKASLRKVFDDLTNT